MTPAFTWLMGRRNDNARLLLVGPLLIRLERVTGQWVAQWATLHRSVGTAHVDAINTTESLEANGLPLDGPVFVAYTDTDPEWFHRECKSGRQVGPRVGALLSESEWRAVK